MTDMNKIQDTLNLEEHDIKRLPQVLNVLTILTYVGCGLGLLSAIWSFMTVCKSVKTMEKGMADLDQLGGALGGMMDGAMKIAQKQCDNKMIVLLVTLIGLALCFYGAMQMRNLKKQGFLIYAVGELLVPLALLVILGAGSMGFMMILGLIVPVVMVIVYATQREHLIH